MRKCIYAKARVEEIEKRGRTGSQETKSPTTVGDQRIREGG